MRCVLSFFFGSSPRSSSSHLSAEGLNVYRAACQLPKMSVYAAQEITRTGVLAIANRTARRRLQRSLNLNFIETSPSPYSLLLTPCQIILYSDVTFRCCTMYTVSQKKFQPLNSL